MKTNGSNNPLWIATVLLTAGLLVIFLLYYGTRQIQVGPTEPDANPTENVKPLEGTPPGRTSTPPAGSNR